MTHTLHRKPDALDKDYVLLVMSAKGINEKKSFSKLRKALDILEECGAVCLGDMKSGNSSYLSLDDILENVTDQSIVHGVFVRKMDLEKALKTLKETDLGMSVVVSGLFDEVFKTARNAGLQPHTVNISLGIWGKTELLPKDGYLQISTMCGHGMVPTSLITDVIEDVRKGLVTIDQAALKLTRCCVCGVFNPVKAASLIRKMAEF